MNSIESITKKIIDDANAAAQAKIQEAQAEADSILKDYNGQAAQVKEEAKKAAEKEAAALRERVESQSELAKRNLLLQYKRAAISKAFDLALEQICAQDADKQVELLSSAAAKYQTQNAEVILNEADRKAFGDKLISSIQKKLKDAGKDFQIALSSKSGNFAGGMILVEGSIETNCSYEILIKNMRDDLEGEVSKILSE